MELSVKNHAQLLESGADPSEADLRFHLLLGVASKNSLLQHHVEEVVSVLDQHLWRTMKLQSLSDSAHAATYLGEHRKVLDAVKAGNGEAASTAMSAHLDSIEEHLLALVS